MGQSILILASNSPRRRELLRLGGWKFISIPAEVDESQLPDEAPASYVLRLAETKLQACSNSPKFKGLMSTKNRKTLAGGKDLTILAADTSVVDGKAILGKPKDATEAAEMLGRLRNRTHQVYTGIAVMRMSDGNSGKDVCITDVPMRDYSEEEIAIYVASGDPLDKAGAYAIQHPRFHPVEKVTGCYASVMGLPLCHLTRCLRPLEITPRTNISAKCQTSLNYTCQISTAVLRGEQVG
jgi:septum formation protein